MCIFNYFDFRTNRLNHGISHIGIMRTGITNWIPLGYARCEDDMFSASFNHQFGSGNRPFSGASSASDKTHNFHGACMFKGELTLRCHLEVHCSRAHIFCLLTTNYPNFIHVIFLLSFVLSTKHQDCRYCDSCPVAYCGMLLTPGPTHRPLRRTDPFASHRLVSLGESKPPRTYRNHCKARN